jgi:hypothetical protein
MQSSAVCIGQVLVGPRTVKRGVTTSRDQKSVGCEMMKKEKPQRRLTCVPSICACLTIFCSPLSRHGAGTLTLACFLPVFFVVPFVPCSFSLQLHPPKPNPCHHLPLFHPALSHLPFLARGVTNPRPCRCLQLQRVPNQDTDRTHLSRVGPEGCR